MRYTVKATAHGCTHNFERVIVAVNAMAAVRRMARWMDDEGWRPRRVEAENVDDGHDIASKTFADTADSRVTRDG